MKNTPYVKEHQNGIVSNPITKDKPFLVSARPDKRKVRRSNNRKGNGLVVARIGTLAFAKYKIVKQRIENRLVVNSIYQP